MSVRVPDRRQSEIQYLYSSMELRDFVVTQLCKFAPKQREYLLNKICDFAWECHQHCTYADMLFDRHRFELEQQYTALLKAKRCCKDIDSASTLLFKKLRQNPENYDRYVRMPSEARIRQISVFLEKLAAHVVKTEELIDIRLQVLQVLLAEIQA